MSKIKQHFRVILTYPNNYGPFNKKIIKESLLDQLKTETNGEIKIQVIIIDNRKINEYHRKYIHQRLKTDPEFRKRRNMYAKKYYEKHKKEILKRQHKRFVKRYYTDTEFRERIKKQAKKNWKLTKKHKKLNNKKNNNVGKKIIR